MNFKHRITMIAVAATAAAGLALPGSALAEYYVPPGNSAANQYTEALPGAGGESAGKRGSTIHSPEESLGKRNAQRLEAQGPAGRAAAQVAAETAPPASLVAAARRTEGAGGNGDAGGGSKQRGGGGTSNDGGGNAGSAADSGGQPSGSSGLGEVLGQATGSSDSGNLGLWLPIVIVLTLAGSIAYRLRPRSGPTA
jgi:hypothetical protein